MMKKTLANGNWKLYSALENRLAYHTNTSTYH